LQNFKVFQNDLTNRSTSLGFSFQNLQNFPNFVYMNEKKQNLKIWAGLWTLYLVWGSTFLGVRVVVESIPSMIVSGFRNIIAGAIMIGLTFATKKYQKPTKDYLRVTTISGFMMLTMGNGFLAVAAQWMPSSFSALFGAMGPVMLVVLLWIMNHEKPQKIVILGALLGIIGVAILMSQKKLALHGSEQYYFWGVLFLFFAVLGWNLGVVWLKKQEINHFSSMQTSGFQMFIGGVFATIISYFLGDFKNFHPTEIPTTTYFWASYLIIVGSIIAFLVFSWLSKVTEPTLIATYTYVNPMVAMLLGWLFAGERLSTLMLVAGIFIISAVILISTSKKTSQNES
jgi:drug/metabolite transporter (DMT)-like permease